MRILVADDDQDILDLLVFKLTEAGFDTEAVADGTAALAAIEADPPRLAILDITMPGMSGIDVLRQVRASETLGDLAVILLTANTTDSDVDTGFAAGASDYVTKPFTPEGLLERVEALTQQNHALRQIQARELGRHQVILEIGHAIRGASDTQQALDVMCLALGEGLGVDRVIANTLGIRREVGLSAQWHRPGLRPWSDLRTPLNLDGLAQELWVSSGFWAEDDLLTAEQQPPAAALPLLQSSGARAGIIVPIGLQDRVIGVIHVLMMDGPRAWTVGDSDVVQAVAGFVARAIEGVEHQRSQREYADRVESLDRQKSDFLATVSHELRTPLTSISGYLEVLQGQEVGELTAQQQRMLDAISRNTIRLRNLIEDVMVLSRIEGGVSEANFVEVSIRGLITRVVEDLSLLAAGSSIKLEIDAGPDTAMVLGDRVSLDRALVNVLANAIKFSHPAGVVTLRGTLDQDTGRILITCQDNGIGIPAHDLADLFTRFFRASNATDKAIPGTGLGLSIAKQIVEDHHGELRLTSVEEEGTTVIMDLPMYDGH